jgi:hypothetical protein
MRIPATVSISAAALLAVTPVHGTSRDLGLRVRAELGSSVVYDDNVLLEDDARQSDVAFGIAPSVGADYLRPRWKVGADVGADSRFYLDHSQLNDTFFRAEAYGEIEPLRGLTVRVSDHYVPQPVVLGRPEDETANLAQSNTLLAEARYWHELRSNAALEVGVRGARFTADAFPASLDLDGDGVIETDHRFRSDYWGGAAFAEGQLSVGKGTVAFVRGEYRARRFDELSAADFDEISGLIGVRTRLGGRLSIEAAGGYGRVDFAALPERSRWLGRLSLAYDLPRGLTLRASLMRRLTGDATATDFGETSARLGIEKQLGTRTSVYAGAWWALYDSDAPGVGSNRVLAAELALRRRLTQRIEAILAYRRWRNHGSFDGDDFTQNRVTLGLVYRY